MLTLGWLRYRDLCKLKLLCLAHKAIYTGEPKYLAEILSIATSNRPRRDCHAMKLVMPHTNSCFGNSAFSVAVPTLWNLLPNIIRTITSRSQFKSRLFKHFLVKLIYIYFAIIVIFVYMLYYYYIIIIIIIIVMTSKNDFHL